MTKAINRKKLVALFYKKIQLLWQVVHVQILTTQVAICIIMSWKDYPHIKTE